MYAKLLLLLSMAMATPLSFSLDKNPSALDNLQLPPQESLRTVEDSNASSMNVLQKTRLPNIAEENAIPEALNKEYLQMQKEEKYTHYYLAGNMLIGWPFLPFKWTATANNETQSFNGITEPNFNNWLSYEISAGYQSNRFLALELGYTKLADLTVNQFGSILQSLKDVEDKTFAKGINNSAFEIAVKLGFGPGRLESEDDTWVKLGIASIKHTLAKDTALVENAPIISTAKNFGNFSNTVPVIAIGRDRRLSKHILYSGSLKAYIGKEDIPTWLILSFGFVATF
jgi:hypothetical protein